VPPIRVVLATMPRLLGDIVRETLAAHQDVTIIADVATRDELTPAIRRTDATVAIIGVESDAWNGLNDLLRALLAERPRLTVIALASDGRTGYVLQLLPSAVAIDDISPQSLVETIRVRSTMDVHPMIHPFSAD
jgi:DNA-binding NarL/FixJ family response regulator